MEQKLDDKSMETDAIINLLIRKGIISYEEIFTELKQVKFQNDLSNQFNAEKI